jgi:hypothetical protein
MYSWSGIFHQGLNRLIEFCLRFCRANAYINSKTDEGENDVFVSLCEGNPIDLLSSNVVTVGKIFSSVCGKSLKYS